MPNYSIGFVIFGGGAVIAGLFIRQAFRVLKRSGRREMSTFRYGGWQCIIGLLTIPVALTGLAFGFGHL